MKDDVIDDLQGGIFKITGSDCIHRARIPVRNFELDACNNFATTSGSLGLFEREGELLAFQARKEVGSSDAGCAY